MREREVMANGRLVGKIGLSGKALWFEYDSKWETDGFPISASLPFGQGPFRESAARFLGNLLPEERRGATFQRLSRLSPKDVFDFISVFGLDLAGCISIGHEKGEVPVNITGKVKEIIARRASLDLAGLRLSLAGADPKLAVILKDGEFFAPNAENPSTHIIKATDILAEAEAVSMFAAREFGLDVCNCEMRIIAGYPALVIERYDRVKKGNSVLRLPQEDFCQRCGLADTGKYCGNDVMIKAIKDLPAEDRLKFLSASMFNSIFGNTDDHGKNYSLLLKKDGWRLAPFYDIISARSVKMAFKLYKNLDARLSRPFGRHLLPAKINARDFILHAHAYATDPRWLADEWMRIAGRLAEILDGLTGRFMESVPPGLLSHKEKDVLAMSRSLEKNGGKFARAMLEVGERALKDFPKILDRHFEQAGASRQKP